MTKSYIEYSAKISHPDGFGHIVKISDSNPRWVDVLYFDDALGPQQVLTLSVEMVRQTAEALTVLANIIERGPT